MPFCPEKGMAGEGSADAVARITSPAIGQRLMVDSQPLAAGRNEISGWISIGYLMLFCRGLLQNLLHSRLKRFGLRPRLSRFNLLARQLRFQFRAETISSVFGLL